MHELIDWSHKPQVAEESSIILRIQYINDHEFTVLRTEFYDML